MDNGRYIVGRRHLVSDAVQHGEARLGEPFFFSEVEVALIVCPWPHTPMSQISTLGLSTRLCHELKIRGYSNVEDLRNLSPFEAYQLREMRAQDWFAIKRALRLRPFPESERRDGRAR